MELQININLDNAAFGDNPADEAGRIIENYRENLKNSSELPDKYSFIDFNGNQVGEAKVIKEKPEPAEEKPAILVEVYKGTIADVSSNQEINLLVLDHDLLDEVTEYKTKKIISAGLFEVESIVNKKKVKHYQNQI